MPVFVAPMTKEEMLKDVPFESIYDFRIHDYRESFKSFEEVTKQLRSHCPKRKGSFYQPVEDFFTGENADVIQNYEFITVDDLPENEEFIEDQDGYTYNDCGYTDRDFAYKTYEAEENYYVFISFHYGQMDARCGFTDWFIMKFENRWDWEEFLDHSFEIAYIEVGHHQFGVTARATWEVCSVYDYETNKDYEGGMLFGDEEEVIYSLRDLFAGYSDQENMPVITDEQWKCAKAS